MTERTYVGNRYVPKIIGEWTSSISYEGLSIVTNEGNSYTSKKNVPIGIPLTNEEYWVVTGNYNAQIENYRNDVKDVKASNDDLTVKVNELSINVTDFGAIGDGVTDSTNAIQNAINSLDTKNGGILFFPTGTYMVSQSLVIPSNKITIKGANNATTIIKALTVLTNIITVSNQVRISIRDIQLNGNSKATNGLWTDNVGQLFLDNVVVQGCLNSGILLNSNTWMFNFNNVYVLNNETFGIWIGDNCAGSKMNMVICEENGINLRVGYTRTINFLSCTFQRFSAYGNVLLEASWDLTFDTCWLESNSKNITGETYDFKMVQSINENIGHNIRLLNNSFKGTWGDGTLGVTKHCIIDYYADTFLQGNYIDGSQGGYTSGLWYDNKNESTKVVGLTNTVSGGQNFNLKKYAMWQLNVGVSPDSDGFSDDQQLNIARLRISNRMSLLPQTTDPGFDYNGRLYASESKKRLRIALDDKYWDLIQALFSTAPPTSGTYKIGNLTMNTNKTGGQPLGWVCTVAGTPGTWTSFGGQATTQPSSTATDITGLRTEFNYLLDKLKSCGLMSN